MMARVDDSAGHEGSRLVTGFSDEGERGGKLSLGASGYLQYWKEWLFRKKDKANNYIIKRNIILFSSEALKEKACDRQIANNKNNEAEV